MEKACIDASAVSHGDYLLVINGQDKEVNVYNGHYWAKAECLLENLLDAKSIIFNDNLYVIGLPYYESKVYSALLDSLIASCQPSKTSQPSSLWKMLPHVPDGCLYPTVFGRRLSIIGASTIHAYSPSTQSWIRVGDNGLHLFSCVDICSIGLPLNELMVVHDREVYKATIKCKFIRNYYYTVFL